MKNKVTFLAAMASLACVAQQPVTLNGTVSSDINKLYISVGFEGDYGVYKPAVAVDVRDGKFTFSTSLNEVVSAWVHADSLILQDTPVQTVYLIPGETLNADFSKPTVLHEGTGLYKGFRTAFDSLDHLYNKVQMFREDALNFLRSLPEDSDEDVAEHIADSLSSVLHSLSSDYQNALDAFRNSHLDDAGALVYLSDFVDNTELYAAVSDDIKNTSVGRYLQSRVEHERKIAEYWAQQEAEEQAEIDGLIGTPAPSIELNDLNGNLFSLSSLRGKYVILDFWGSWCGWCIKGFPDMKAYYEKYKGKFEILGVDCGDTDAKWRKAVESLQLPWLHVYSPDSKVTEDYNIKGYPTKILVDPDGNIAKIIIGEDPAFYDFLDELFGK